MKKIILLLGVVVGVAAVQAQTITPLNITLSTLRMDSIRENTEGDEAYYDALEQWFSLLQEEEEQIRVAANHLREEKSHCNELEAILKSREKQAKEQDKLLAKEDKIHKRERKHLEKQRKALHGNQTLDSLTLNASLQEVDEQERKIIAAEQALQQKCTQLNQEREAIKSDMITLYKLRYEIQLKESRFNTLKMQHNLQKETLKNEINAIKKTIKINKNKEEYESN